MLWLLLACGEKEEADTAVSCSVGYRDADGDGYGDDYDEWCGVPTAAEGWDCDDNEPAAHPGAAEVCGDGIDNDCNGRSDCADGCELASCPEVCGDGVDNDADGFTDCPDDDCAEHLTCAEDCDDGVDNDLDGLTDCEDGDCLWAGACIEDCSDGVDDDHDGLIDCDDDDCLWTVACDHPGGIKLTLQGGGGVVSTYQQLGIYHFNTYTSQRTHSSVFSNVIGIVQVLPEGQSNWSTATSTITCGWSVEEVGIRSRRTATWMSSFLHFEGTPVRDGVSIEDGCRLSDPRFLPDRILLGQIPTHSVSPYLVTRFADWYNGYTVHGAVTDSWPQRTSSAYTSEGGLNWFQRRTLTVELTGSPTYFRLP